MDKNFRAANGKYFTRQLFWKCKLMPDRRLPQLPDDLYFQGDPNDTRFQFEVIKQLADSIREMNTTQTRILERLARIEEQRVHEIAVKLSARIGILEEKETRREGAYTVFSWLRIWGPVLFSFFAAIWLFGRSLGIVPAPPLTDAPKTEAVLPREVAPASREIAQ